MRPQDVSAADAATWLTELDAPIVVDVRTPAEFAASRIDGAVNVPLDLIEKDAERIGSQLEGEVLFVCQSDARAHSAATRLAPYLRDRGHVLTCGMGQWERDGRPTVGSPGGTWAMERQVRATAGGIVLASILTSIAVPRARFVAGFIGAGLVYAGVSNTCGMAKLLAQLPWNKRQEQPSVDEVVARLRTA